MEEHMKKRINTRINTLFSKAAYQWLNEEAETQNKSLAQVVRDKIELARKEDAVLNRIIYLEKVIKKSHTVLIKKFSGVK
jgi:hypothetical protein